MKKHPEAPSRWRLPPPRRLRRVHTAIEARNAPRAALARQCVTPDRSAGCFFPVAPRWTVRKRAVRIFYAKMDMGKNESPSAAYARMVAYGRCADRMIGNILIITVHEILEPLRAIFFNSYEFHLSCRIRDKVNMCADYKSLIDIFSKVQNK